MKRTLTLSAESLGELSSDDLAGVVGGQTLTGYYPTLPPVDCFLTPLTGQ